MAEKTVRQTGSVELRRRAEERLGENARTLPPPGTMEDQLRLLHELQVHQIELEMQNEELRHAMDEMADVQEKFSDHYDFAPIGFFTLDRAGTIRSVNLTGAGLLGIERSRLNGQSFAGFVADEARPPFGAFLEKVFAGPAKEACEVAFLKNGNPPSFVQIKAVATISGRECHIALIDITERKRAEDALRLTQEIAGASSGDIINKSMSGDAIPGNIFRVIDYIDRNLLGRLTLDKLAQEACMSKFHFCRSFKKSVGITPLQYIIAMRLKLAIILLLQKNKKISTVAAESGFNELSDFNKQFKKTYGLSPSLFRKRKRQQTVCCL